MQQMIFIADLIACSTCFGHHYAHHQELESIMQKVAACGIWCFAAAHKSDAYPSAPHHTDNLKTKAPNTTGSNLLYNTLELLMMGIMVPETCRASNKICNKNHLLHLVGILFLHINYDAPSKSLQIVYSCLNNSIFNVYLIKIMYIHASCIQIGRDNKYNRAYFKFGLPFSCRSYWVY